MLRSARICSAIGAIWLLACPGAGTSAGIPFRGWSSEIGPQLQRRMTGVSWREGCPVGLEDLRYLTLRHWGFDRRVHTGHLVVHRDSALRILRAFRRLYAKEFPIRRMTLVDNYGGNDFRSIEADNTSAFNCRAITGGTAWSEHAYGRAIDVNPIENPYVSDGSTAHTASVPYLQRSPYRPGMAVAGGDLVEAFKAIGWGWGGFWTGSVQDYQHFSATGR